MQAYKGMDKNMKCRDFQYEVGKEYEHKGDVKLCESGFHACENPLDVWNYYPLNTSRFFEVQQDGQTKTDTDKTVSSKIQIKAELSLSAFIKCGIEFLWQKIKNSATTGNYAHSATTGDEAHSATTGNYAHSATTGDEAHSATTGDEAHSATTGNYAHSATTGDEAHSATTGNYAHSATTGNYAHSATTGDYAHSATTGNYAHSATTGDEAHSATTGNYAHSATTGNYAHSATTGNYAHSATTGNYAHSATTGDEAIASALGVNSRAKAVNGWIILVDWRYGDNKWNIKNIHHAKVGEKIQRTKIKPDVWYWFKDGKLKSEKAGE